jgi:hypothetical protein
VSAVKTDFKLWESENRLQIQTFGLGKWMQSSAANSARLEKLHELHCEIAMPMLTPAGRISQCVLALALVQGRLPQSS